MRVAKSFARLFSKDKTLPGGAVIVYEEIIIGLGANGSDHHEKSGCRRAELGCKTGEGYELCEGCHPKNHSEPRAIQNALSRGYKTKGADLYLWGHWWCCKWCWDSMLKAGIKNVYLLEKSEVLFNKEHPDNMIGKQLDLPMTHQEDLFVLHIKSFVSKPGRRQILAERFKDAPSNIDDWLEGNNLPGMNLRTLIMDYIWNYPCFYPNS